MMWASPIGPMMRTFVVPVALLLAVASPVHAEATAGHGATATITPATKTITPATKKQTGSLRVGISRDKGYRARVVVRGKHHFRAKVRTTTTLRGLTPGRYRVRASAVGPNAGSSVVEQSRRRVRVVADHRAKIRVSVRAEPPSSPTPAPTPSPSPSPTPSATPTPSTTPTPAPPDPPAPGSITGLAVTQRTIDTIALSWTNPSDPDLASVIVRRASGSTPPTEPNAGTGVPWSAASPTTATDSGLTQNSTYSYALFTRDTDGITSTTPVTVTTTTARQDQITVVGDIGWCGSAGVAQTAGLIADTTGPMFAPGDIAYPNGTSTDFANCYDPHFGPFKDRTWPVPGNHEYNTDAVGYFGYFGSRVGTAGDPWYSTDIGGWHFVMLNSNCSKVGGCDATSRQYQWLVQDLAAHPTQCLVAVTHHPRYSSGPHGNNDETAPLWALLTGAGADMMLSGHDHDYERFARMDSSGAQTPSGIRQFVVGTGGAPLYSFGTIQPNSEFRSNDAFGVLALTLDEDAYSWRFITGAGATTDSGSDQC